MAIGRRSDRWLRLAAGLGLLAIVVLEALLWRVFPGSGRYPFSTAELAAACAYCALSAAFAWRVAELRALRWVFPVYGVACLAFFFLSTRRRREHRPAPVRGDPAQRARALAARLAAARARADRARARDRLERDAAGGQLRPRRRTTPPRTRRTGSPRSRILHANLTPSYRVEAVDTAGHWPALYLARAGIPLARGWFRQDDFPQNEVLYDDLGPRAYLGWLRGLGVRYVVLTDAPTDYSARGEAALIRGGRTPLRPVFTEPAPDRVRAAARDADPDRTARRAGDLDDRVADRRRRPPGRQLPPGRALLALLAALRRLR